MPPLAETVVPDEEIAGKAPRLSAGAGGAPHEIELKLLASPQALEQLRDSEFVARHARNRGVTRRLHAVYYDTPERLLSREGVSLRVRRSGRRYVMTAKRAASETDPLARAEWEVALPDTRPDPALLPLAEIGEPLSTVPDASLLPVFATEVRRRAQRLDMADASIELACDEGVIEAGERREPICELELELKAGNPAALYEVALALLDVAPLRLETMSKAERGHALAFGDASLARKAVPVALAASDDVDAAIVAVLSNIHGHLLGNLAAAAHGRPEAVHQMRVALRRLRSALSLFRRELGSLALAELAAQARSLSHVLGPARNWDVFVTQTVPRIAEHGLDDAGLDRLAAAAGRFREQSYADLREALAGPDVNRFLLSFGALLGRRGWRSGLAGESQAVLELPAPGFAARVLDRVHRKARRRGRRFRKLSPAARHDLRLALKKLRYTVEFFLPLHAGAPGARKYLARLAHLQEALGLANDIATTRSLLDILRREDADADIHFAAGAVLGWQRRAERDGERRLRKAWRAFKAATPFWG